MGGVCRQAIERTRISSVVWWAIPWRTAVLQLRSLLHEEGTTAALGATGSAEDTGVAAVLYKQVSRSSGSATAKHPLSLWASGETSENLMMKSGSDTDPWSVRLGSLMQSAELFTN